MLTSVLPAESAKKKVITCRVERRLSSSQSNVLTHRWFCLNSILEAELGKDVLTATLFCPNLKTLVYVMVEV